MTSWGWGALALALAVQGVSCAFFLAALRRQARAAASNAERGARAIDAMRTDLARELAESHMRLLRETLHAQSELRTELSESLHSGTRRLASHVENALSHTRQDLGDALSALGELNASLNLPHMRGRLIGERSLERLLADFLPAAYFGLQVPIGGKVVDAVLRYPHLGIAVPIDSKFPLEQVAALFDAGAGEAGLRAARRKLADVVKQNARDIKSKYIRPDLGTTDFAFIYLPSETLYFEVVLDEELWRTLLTWRVFPVSPNTLAVTVHSLGHSLKYYETAMGVEKWVKQIHAGHAQLAKVRAAVAESGERLAKAQVAQASAEQALAAYEALTVQLFRGVGAGAAVEHAQTVAPSNPVDGATAL